jgi:hypothetical protein
LPRSPGWHKNPFKGNVKLPMPVPGYGAVESAGAGRRDLDDRVMQALSKEAVVDGCAIYQSFY